LGLRVTSLVDYLTYFAPTSERSLVVAVGVAEAAAVLIATAALTALGVHSLRRLPNTPPGRPAT
jgi:hypothetical protein